MELEALHSAAAVPPNIAWGTEPGLRVEAGHGGWGGRVRGAHWGWALLTNFCTRRCLTQRPVLSAAPLGTPSLGRRDRNRAGLFSPPCAAPHRLAPGFPSCPPTGQPGGGATRSLSRGQSDQLLHPVSKAGPPRACLQILVL